MTHIVKVTEIAAVDVDQTYDWIAERSQLGADHWKSAVSAAILQLADTAEQHPRAAESAIIQRDIREAYFKTKSGRKYRLIFAIAEDEVRVLRVRGPGQAPLNAIDLD